MPHIACDYCNYVGRGKNSFLKWKDVEKHERQIHKKESFKNVQKRRE